MENLVLDIGYNPPPKKKILVVDDEIALQSLFFDAFSDDFNIVSAHSGQEGFAEAEQTKPDIILMDVMMSDMSGHEVVKLLMANEITKKIPVIVMTAQDFDASTEQMLKGETNVVAFLRKPFQIAELRGIIQGTLAKVKTGS